MDQYRDVAFSISSSDNKEGKAASPIALGPYAFSGLLFFFSVNLSSVGFSELLSKEEMLCKKHSHGSIDLEAKTN